MAIVWGGARVICVPIVLRGAVRGRPLGHWRWGRVLLQMVVVLLLLRLMVVVLMLVLLLLLLLSTPTATTPSHVHTNASRGAVGRWAAAAATRPVGGLLRLRGGLLGRHPASPARH